jgi:DNA-binding NarL/FixJ family response regulator
MDDAGVLARGRAAFEQRSWTEAFEALSKAHAVAPLEPDDLVRLATSAHLVGEDASAAPLWTRAHHGYLSRGDVPRAAWCAYWMAMQLNFRGDRAQGAGWIARATRMLDEGAHDCVERGYLLFARALGTVMDGDPGTARELFTQARAIGERLRDPTLVAFARHGEGRSMINLGEPGAGAALLDEVMADIAAGDVSPFVVGDIYCSSIEACREMLDVRRAQEWTAALSGWCETELGTRTYRGECLVHRAELLILRGAWPDAAEEGGRARDLLSQPPPHRAFASALYQIGEVHRLRGDFRAAEEAYQQASRAGRDPQPGLALLRLACGQLESARTAIARALDDPGLRRRRALIVPAYIEIALAANDVDAARSAAEVLVQLAPPDAAAYLRGLAAHAVGAVSLAEGDPRAAMAALRRAATLWDEIGAPYDAARTRALIGLGCRALGDEESAMLELDASHAQFVRLGATPDAERVARLRQRGTPPADGGLTSRELEVLRLIASGRTNRAIARALGIADKTVARHVSNIFTKLGLSSRSAATAYAYEHGLLDPHT